MKNRKIRIKYFLSKLYRDKIRSSNNHFDHISIFEISKIRPSITPIGKKVAENRVKLFSQKFLKAFFEKWLKNPKNLKSLLEYFL